MQREITSITSIALLHHDLVHLHCRSDSIRTHVVWNVLKFSVNSPLSLRRV